MGKILRIVATVILLAGYTVHSQVWLVSQTIPSHGLHVKSGGGDSSILSVDTTVVTMKVYNAGVEKSIKIDTSTTSGIIVRDHVTGAGIQFYDDYSIGSTVRSAMDKEYIGTHIGYQNLDANMYNPSESEHGWIVVYDSNGLAAGTDKYKLNATVSVAGAAGMVIEAFDTIKFSNTDLTLMIDDLPVGSVVWEIQIFLETAFDGSGTNLLDVGITGDADKFINDFDLENPATTFYGLGSLPYRTIATTDFTFQYADSGADAAAGEAYYYIKYTIH